ncbi:Os09g0265050 [Oryza sativa Japonica Group]|uniref:Os09g0265050 protein n=1 Tax=Oryza sativa subsp. japonica TaxID=39947 RepID=C7J6J3_ORYSJ|nr:Os09g0265050 [Oryza sativa Japonica Group]|eukprot:NP_001175741.1 Os09g0265050 [Oryza sativa Japonica Group]
MAAIVDEPRSFPLLLRSILSSPCRIFLLLISSSLVQPIDGNAAVHTGALERALCTAAVTSSPFPLICTKPGQAVAPASSPRPPLHFPSRISKDGATSVEIVHRLLHLRSPSPLPNPPPPFLELIEPSPFTRRFLPPPSRYTSRRHQPSYPSHV